MISKKHTIHSIKRTIWRGWAICQLWSWYFTHSQLFLHASTPRTEMTPLFSPGFFLVYSVWQHILSGNTNCVLSPLLDGSVSKRASLSKSTQAIFLFLETRGVADVWWFSNPTSRAKAYCSPVHKTYSCIYFIFLDKRILHLTTECDYRAIVTSDHSPLFMKLHIPNIQSTYRPWKFNPLLLSGEEFTTFISSKTELSTSIKGMIKGIFKGPDNSLLCK